jgi:hypothetical protein
MAVMFAHLYSALLAAGVPDDKAQKAAEEMASANPSFEVGQLRSDVTEVKSEVRTMRSDLSSLKADNAVLKWMLGFLLASVLGGFAVVTRLLVR